jgi:hypothetical protein
MDSEFQLRIIFGITFVILGISLGILSTNYILNLPNGSNILSNIESSNCTGLDLITTSTCLNLQLKEFYHYNISNVGKEMTLDQLKTEGGVCEHYAKWYNNQSSNLGFNSKYVTFYINSTMLHAINIMSDKSGYCIQDQIDTKCFKFANGI